MNYSDVRALYRQGATDSTPSTDPAAVALWLSLTEFGYERIDDGGAIVRLMAALDDNCGFPEGVALRVERRRARPGRPAFVSATPPRPGSERRSVGPTSCLLWEVSFDLPLEVVTSPRSLFTLTASNRLALGLPVPRAFTAFADVPEIRGVRGVGGARIRRHAAALTAGVAIAVAVGSAGGGALAGTVASTDATTTATTATATTTTPTTDAATTPTDTTTTPTSTTTTPTSTTTTPTDTTTTPTPTTTTTTPTATTPTPTLTSSPGATLTGGTPTTPPPAPRGGDAAGHPASPGSNHPAGNGGGHEPAQVPHGAHRHGQGARGHGLGAQGRRQGAHGHRGHGTETISKHSPTRHGAGHAAARHASVSVPEPPVLATTPGSYSLDPFLVGELSRLSTLIGTTNQPPAFLISIYKAAGHRYHIPWQILAAINAIETDYGRDLSVSPAGAIGWMQFMPATWLQYGVDVTGRGHPNPYDPRDAIFAAARYLAANGGATDISRAIFAYNHALWYVDAVLWRAQTITDTGIRFGLRGTSSAYALPLDARYLAQMGRTDDGVDIEDAPDGAAVYSITPGVVTAVASDPTGFGPDYPVILATSGPLQGQYIYYGHVAASLVTVGQHVLAGQPVAVMGHTGDAVSLGHGHIEIGFSDGSGDPVNHHSGSDAWTPAGAEMRTVLVALSRAYGIKNS